MIFRLILSIISVVGFIIITDETNAHPTSQGNIKVPKKNNNHDQNGQGKFGLRVNQNHLQAPVDLTTKKVNATTSSYFADLYSYVPTDFTWYGNYLQNYKFGDDFNIGRSSLCIGGNAGVGGRGFESTFTITGDSRIQISYYAVTSCADPGLFIFPTAQTSYWDWYARSGRIQYAIDCGKPCLYGEVSTSCADSTYLPTGQWYTLVLYHKPSSGSTYAYVYSGFDTNISSSSPLASMNINEYFSSSSPLRVGFNADNEDTTGAGSISSLTNFANIRIDYGYDGSSDDDNNASVEPITSYSNDLLNSLPSEMIWYGGYGLGYMFSTSYTGINSLNIYGDAGNDGTGRGLESSFYVSGDFTVRVSFYMNDICDDPGISIFPSQSGWFQGSRSGRIQASLLCGISYIFGQSTYTYSSLSLSTGYWYTMVLSHLPYLAYTSVSYYQGIDIDPSTAIALGTTTLSEYFPTQTSLHVGIAADTDSYFFYCQFAYLRVTSDLEVSSQTPSQYPTVLPTIITKTPTLSPASFSSYYASLYYSLPSDIVWYGGGSLTYSFGAYYTSVTSLQIAGDAGSGGRGAETTIEFYGDLIVRVSFYMYESCTDPGVSIFPTAGSSYWYWGAYSGRIQAAVDCGTPSLYGETYSQSDSSGSMLPGYWYTIVLKHKPSNYMTTVSFYRGYDVDPATASIGSLITTLTIYEYYYVSSNLRVGLAADTDSTYSYCQFAELRVSSDGVGGIVGGGSTSSPTVAPTKAPYVADLLSSIPSDMSWYYSSSTSYSFGDIYGTGISSFAIHGDAVDGSRGLETTFTRSGDFSVRVSFYLYTECTDPGLTIFTSKSYWYFGTQTGRIQLSVNCGYPVLYGTTKMDLSPTSLPSGYWYTMVLSHSASTIKTRAFFYQGYNIDPTSSSSISTVNADVSDANRPVATVSKNTVSTVKPLSGTLIASLSIPESFAATKSLGIGINADTDSFYSYCQFAYLKVSDGAMSGGGSVDDDDSTGTISTTESTATISALSMTTIMIIIIAVVGAVCICCGAWIFFAVCRGTNSAEGQSSGANAYPDFSSPSAPPDPALYAPVATGGDSVIPSNMSDPVQIESQADPALMKFMGVSSTQTFEASTFGSSLDQIPMAIAVPVSSLSSPYAPLPIDVTLVSDVYESGGDNLDGRGSTAYGEYNVEMVSLNESVRNDVL